MISWEIAIKRLLPLFELQEMKDAQLSLLTRPEIKSLRSMWYGIYGDSVLNKVFIPVENLPIEEKTTLWDYTRQIAPELNREDKIKLSKCLYAIEYYLNNPL